MAAPEELRFKAPKVLLSHIELNAYKPANENNCIFWGGGVNPTCNVAWCDTINLGFINFQKLLAGWLPLAFPLKKQPKYPIKNVQMGQ